MNQENKEQVAVLQLLCSLEFAHASMNWYFGQVAGRPDLPPHEQYIALSYAIASLGESLHMFHKRSRQEVLTKSETWTQKAKQSWDLLKTPEVRKFEENSLILLRNQSAFHFDPEAVVQFIKHTPSDGSTVTVWKTNQATSGNGYSPLAIDIIKSYLLSLSFDKNEVAKKIGEIYAALREVVAAYVKQAFNVSLSNDAT